MGGLTEVADVVARAVLGLPYGGEMWAVLEGRVLVADVVEEVDLLLAREERRAYAVDGCVAPALLGRCWRDISTCATERKVIRGRQ